MDIRILKAVIIKVKKGMLSWLTDLGMTNEGVTSELRDRRTGHGPLPVSGRGQSGSLRKKGQSRIRCHRPSGTERSFKSD
ncbi:hypothetical protein EVAR_65582_1 [Eumeta japonica]|uniref:Uncharacterized protein n=1 Tax=Eumeta variegata TaxID=151549 RepID=A0A4C1Z062_EUMVA|nr:hypothetical protein EVAR_65582_1 [Eumeta japonica]